MIDINELRRLAQAATPHVGHACKYQDAHWLREGHVDFENADLFIASERPQEDAAFYAAANPAVINELLDRLETAEKEVASLRQGVAFRDDVVANLAVERDALRAKIEGMERQEPVGKFIQHPSNGIWEQDGYGDNPDARPLYALPGAKGEGK